MAFRIRFTATASAAVDELAPAQRAQFDDILSFLTTLPYPVRGSELVRTSHVYGRDLMVYFDGAFPFRIYYEPERTNVADRPDIEEWITVVFLVKA
jgi:hypothetical protein